ncbi:EscI/YscI/HrpB family type III secretion system inner rod protein [Hahella sp. CCB-MM4]|uniref:type III secretion system inner rod subunit SctI n=1 Tax=Hahella sp. (strain CCB-MM4) TaxID=1926491 RepID=UPI000B9B77A4|nr:type III secretion system inner rod subunit SctI [Hahella sp. CCB-MM4]OZG74359.1 EscI/YscI/HrpB family type III secretion system inner rod protein [Hahella sp. CCB-MM4]
MEPISIQYSLNLLSTEQSAGNNVGADSVAVEQFQNSLQQPADPSRLGDGNIDAVTTAESAGNSLGDKVLQGLQNMKSGYDRQVGAVQESMNGTDPLRINSMMKLQFDLAKLTLQGELINKTVSKSTQNLDTLLKSQ